MICTGECRMDLASPNDFQVPQRHTGATKQEVETCVAGYKPNCYICENEESLVGFSPLRTGEDRKKTKWCETAESTKTAADPSFQSIVDHSSNVCGGSHSIPPF